MARTAKTAKETTTAVAAAAPVPAAPTETTAPVAPAAGEGAPSPPAGAVDTLPVTTAEQSPAGIPSLEIVQGEGLGDATTPAAAPTEPEGETTHAVTVTSRDLVMGTTLDDDAPEPWPGLIRACGDVFSERFRQVSIEGFDPERDDGHNNRELVSAAICYAMQASSLPMHRAVFSWPWQVDMFKPTTPRVCLVKAAALIMAEIERLDRAEEASAA